MSESKDQEVLSAEDAVALEAKIPDEGTGELSADDIVSVIHGRISDSNELLTDGGDDVLFDKAEVIAPDDMDDVLERASGEMKLSDSSHSLPGAPSHPSMHEQQAASGLMDTVVDDNPKTLQRLQEQSRSRIREVEATKENGGFAVNPARPTKPTPQSSPSSSRMIVYSQEEVETPHTGSPSSPYALAEEQSQQANKSPVSPFQDEHLVSMVVEDSPPAHETPRSFSSVHNIPASEGNSTIDESGPSHASMKGSTANLGEPDRSDWKIPQVKDGDGWDEDSEDPGEANMMGVSLPSMEQHSNISVETLPIYALGNMGGEDMRQQAGIGDKHSEQFEAIIDTLSREGIGTRDAVREDLRKITSAHYELVRTTGIDLPQSYRTMIAEEQEAVWEQLCAHVDLYKDFLYQLFHEMEQWRLSDDCCPNLLCRSPREGGHSICRRCQSEFFLVCPHCKSQTPYFSERCQHLQCGKTLPPEDKLIAAVKITNAYAQRQGKASVAAAAAFVLYYLMERFSITTKGDWFHQIDRYRKVQGRVNQEYQRRCLAAYQDELLRILAPAFEHMRQGILRQVNNLYAERRFVDSLDTLNSMPAVLQNTQIEEIRHRIYERLTEGELNRIESLMQEGKLEQSIQLLNNLTFESPRRRLLLARCQQTLAEREFTRRSERWESISNSFYLLFLVAGAAFHWLAMPSFLGKDSVGWFAPYLLLIGCGAWLLRRRTVNPDRIQWLLGQTVAVMSVFGGVLFVLLGLLFCSWYLTVPDPLQGIQLLPGYRLAPPHANVLPAHTSWRIIYQIAVVGGLMGLFAGGMVGAALGFSEAKYRRVLLSTFVGAFGVCLGVALISSIGITVGSAISVVILNTFAAAIAVAAITAFMVSLGVEIGLKIASDMEVEQLVWGGILGAITGALIGALFGAGVVHNGMTKMQLIHPDVAWAGLPLAAGVVGAILFVVAMVRWGGGYLRFLRWVSVLTLFGGSLTAWLTL